VDVAKENAGVVPPKAPGVDVAPPPNKDGVGVLPKAGVDAGVAPKAGVDDTPPKPVLVAGVAPNVEVPKPPAPNAGEVVPPNAGVLAAPPKVAVPPKLLLAPNAANHNAGISAVQALVHWFRNFHTPFVSLSHCGMLSHRHLRL
jgi:hypothetical protein